MIELEQLKQLIAFATYGTLSKAAEELYISQPALSRSIQKLEKTLGVELFDRKKNKMELNENGKTVIQYAEKFRIINRFRKYDHLITVIFKFFK